MRLTLRTLLAYVDDILEPSQAKEIGAKIAESGFASSLMNRIQDVMRRRRLTAPDLEGPGSGLDPNNVAEYIDNVLPPDKVADVEKVCLESDVHLAEVAASHQILTAALGEPVQVRHQSREHMYALGPPGQSAAGQSSETTEAASNRPPGNAKSEDAGKNDGQQSSRSARTAAQQTGPMRARAAGHFDATIPDFLRPRPVWRRALPYMVVGLIAAGWIALLFYGPPLNPSAGNRGKDAQKGNNGGAQLAANLNDEGPASIDGANGSDRTASRRTSPAGRAQPAGVSPVDRGSIDPPPPADEAEPGTGVVDVQPPVELPLPGGPVEAPSPNGNGPDRQVAANGGAAGAEAVVANPENGGQPPVQAAKLQYNSQEGILLRYDEQVGDWIVLPPRAIMHARERFASPVPFEAVVDVDDSLCRATIIGGTAVRVLPPHPGGAPDVAAGFEIAQGRVILENRKPAAADENVAEAGPLSLAIAVKDEMWRIDLLTPETVCGIEIVPMQPVKPGYDPARDSYSGGLYVVSGSVRFTDGAAPPRVIDAAGWMSLTPADRSPDEEQPAAGAPPLLSIPEWLDPAAKQSTRTVRRYATLFEQVFDHDRPLSENVPPMIKDPRPYISSLSVQCLALVGDYASLAKALNAEHEESRMAAIMGLRNWLPRDEKNGALLKAELQKQFPPDDVEAIQRLLWGYTEQDVRNRTISEQLVVWLDHNDVVVRELAFYHIYRLTGIKYDYHPLRPPLQRRAAIRRWEERIQNEGALLGQPAATP